MRKQLNDKKCRKTFYREKTKKSYLQFTCTNIKTRRFGMIANTTTLHQRNDVEVKQL